MVEKIEKQIKKIDKKEIYEKIEKMTQKGNTNSAIGHELKKLKVRSVRKETGKKIIQIQDELKLSAKEIPDDLMALIKKAVKLIKHKDSNKKDTSGKRGYQLTVSKINRLKKYYIKQGRIPETWRYSDTTAKLLVK